MIRQLTGLVSFAGKGGVRTFSTPVLPITREKDAKKKPLGEVLGVDKVKVNQL